MGFVYFVQDVTNGVVKIGASEDPEVRFQHLQAATVAELVMLRYVEVPDSFQTERRLHVKFSAYRVRGEWFRAESELLEFAVSGDVLAFSVQPVVTGTPNISTDREIRFTIKELSEKTGVSVRTIRYYIANKTMPGPIGMGPGAHYAQQHVDAIREIQALKDAGYSLDNIAAGLKAYKPALQAVPIEWLEFQLAGDLTIRLRKDLPPLRKRQYLDALAELEIRVANQKQDGSANEVEALDTSETKEE